MKSINDQVVKLSGQHRFRPIFSPSVVCMMKALNALRQAFDMHNELTSLKLMTEKTGSIVGALLKECNDLLNDADDAMVFLRVNQGSLFNANHVFSCAKLPNDNHNTTNDLQTKLSVFNVLFDVYKVLSIELHRRNQMLFMACCPTCTDRYLMKEEYQTLIDSIRECLPLGDALIDEEEDPLRMKKMSPNSIMFLETQGSDRNFVQDFATQADISRQSSGCDLVPLSLRQGDSRSITLRVSRRFAENAMYQPSERVDRVLDKLSNRCLTVRNRMLYQSFDSITDLSKMHTKIRQLDCHLSSSCRYNPFRLVNMSDADKSRFTSFFASI